ncbi:glycoside hydrolase family 3 protein [Massilia sp. BSC265]|uniref:glycoside hydrolase family 3 protein n=1 Tax=Massilia sp. BSC265 TaxID=1549812 RepID=UPI0009DD4C3A|nr:glycoside hydrolase family 3 N-terminal domain-containing protein [Massilia sp. BSC265]
MRKQKTGTIGRAGAVLILATAIPALVQAADVRADAETRARTLVARMTMDEKIGQLLNVAPALPRLGIPAYNWWTESLHGAMGPVPTTNFPEPIGLAASFDASLVHGVAAAISVEVRALHTLGRQTGRLGRIGTGLNTWSPNINIFRDPRWGRGQQTYGEDPHLTAVLGISYIQGMQGPNPDLPHVIATPKHFAVHGGPESTRHSADVHVSKHDLDDTYLPAFRAAIVDAKAGSIMCAYNRVNGQPACGSGLLMQDVLRGAWGFKGYVVSDCDAVTDISEHYKYAPDPAAAVAVALKAGTDNECSTKTLGALGDIQDLGKRHREAWQRGLIGMDDIDRALVRLFSARYRNGDLAGLPQRDRKAVPLSAINTAAHQELALQAADYSKWGEPLKLSEVRLEKGQRYPVRFHAETGSTGVPGLYWKRISLDAEADFKAGTLDADVIVAVVGLTADLEGEEMAVKTGRRPPAPDGSTPLYAGWTCTAT